MTEPVAPAVLADDLRALAETVPFDAVTIAMLERAADLIDPPPPPTLEAIADAIQNAFDSSLIELGEITQDGHPAQLWQVGRSLDKAGLIDWRTFEVGS